MKNNKEMIYEIIQDTLNVSKEAVKSITRTPGGETNDSYFVTINDQKYVIRLPGKGTEQLVDRRVEYENLIYGTRLGLHPEIIYFDKISGVKITRKIEGAIPITGEMMRNAGLLKDLIHLLQRLHHAKEPMSHRFDLFAMIRHYEELVYFENPMMMEKIYPIKLIVDELIQTYKTFSVEDTPCHIDTVCSNILKDKNDKLYLIDWEYSGMFDPLMDIATLSFSLDLNEEEEGFFLTYYFGHKPTIEELQRLHLLKIFLDYHWGLWYFYKIAKGEDFGHKGIDRMKRAEKYITSYKSLYGEDLIVS